MFSGMEKPYRCNVCTKTFPTSYKLNRHSYSHSGERPYMCTWPSCLKRFNDNYHLRRHMNTHTGEKPFPCKYPGCSKRYSRSEDLRNHQKTHYTSIVGALGDNSTGTIQLTAIPNSNNDQQQQHHGSSNNQLIQQHHNPNNPDTMGQVLVQQQQTAGNSVGNALVPSSVTFSLSTSSISHPISVSKATARLVTAGGGDPNNTDPSHLVLQSQLNQLQMQLQQQQQSVQQQQAAQQQQQNQFSSTLSPVNQVQIEPSIISIQEVANAAANATQNHVTTGLHIADNYF